MFILFLVTLATNQPTLASAREFQQAPVNLTNPWAHTAPNESYKAIDGDLETKYVSSKSADDRYQMLKFNLDPPSFVESVNLTLG